MILRYDGTTKIAEVAGGGVIQQPMTVDVYARDIAAGYGLNGHLYRVGKLVLYRISGVVNAAPASGQLKETIPYGYRPNGTAYDMVLSEQGAGGNLSIQTIEPDGTMTLISVTGATAGSVYSGNSSWITNDEPVEGDKQ